MEIKNLKKTASRIKKAIAENERIILYGDTDLDGIASVIILEECVKTLGGGNFLVYFPDRGKDGYGLNLKSLKDLRKESPAILIMLDNGIGNFEEIKSAKKLGFEVIIIDHHEILKNLPNASIIVDPKQKGDKYPFKKLATAGIALRLAKLLLAKGFSEQTKKSFTELASLATIADMMPQQEDNKEIIQGGLKVFPDSKRIGINALKKAIGISRYKSTAEKAQKIISAANISNLSNHIPDTYQLLTCRNEKEAQKIAGRLMETSLARRRKIMLILREIEKRAGAGKYGEIVFDGEKKWTYDFLGSVASRACGRFGKPIFIYNRQKDVSRGAVRVPSGKEINAVKALMACDKLLLTYGGHPQAAGFSAKNKNLKKLEERLVEYFCINKINE